MFTNQTLETASLKNATNVSDYEKVIDSIDRIYCANVDMAQRDCAFENR
jgi:hypothetical protein